MASRPTWQGHLKLSLVTCPVALYSALNPSGDVHFHLINPKTNNRIKMITTDPDTGPVERAALSKGYEVDKGRYVLLTDEEIRSVRLESTRALDIERFVPAEDIDRLYWDTPYFVVPDGKLAMEAYGVIREAMEKAGQIALGRVVLSTRERLMALEPRDNGIIAYSLRTHDEVRSADEAFADIKGVKADPDMIAIARKIIEQREGPFDPSKFVDRYEEALKALIAEKSEGAEPVSVEEPEDTTPSDLMAALRASLQGRTEPRARAGRRQTPKPKHPAAKRKPAKRAG